MLFFIVRPLEDANNMQWNRLTDIKPICFVLIGQAPASATANVTGVI